MLNRFVCDALKESRGAIDRVLTHSNLPDYIKNDLVLILSLNEEIQTMANRMEAKLYDNKETIYTLEQMKIKQKELRLLEKDIAKLKEDKEILEEDKEEQ